MIAGMRLFAAALALLASPVAAQQIEWAPEQLPAPSLPGEVRLGSVPSGTADEEVWYNEIVPNGTQLSVRNVTVPTLVPVLPEGRASGAAMIVAPGGAFLGLAIEKEGWDVAHWLADHGVAAFVLKYRVVPSPMPQAEWAEAMARGMRGEAPPPFAIPGDTPDFALADGLAALRHVREHAAEYGIDPHRVGFMGFSAGGFLTRSVVERGGADAPDFAAPIYPSMAPMAVPADAPPLFVTIAADDFLLAGVEGFPLIDSYRAAGASVEFHLLPSGGHGFGLGRPGTPSEGWAEGLLRWMGHIGVLGDAPPAIDTDAANRAIVTDFARLFYTERDVRTAFETYVVEDYVQHNPGVADGRDAAVAMLEPMFSQPGREFRIAQILVDGDMATIHVHAISEPGARGASVFDMYRLENGRIVEHWDAIQPVPETSANDHPMF